MNKAIRHDPYPVDPTFRGIYAHGVETPPDSRTLHISGQVGRTHEGVVPVSFEEQCRLACENLIAVLDSANMVVEDIVKMTFFLIRREDLDSLVEVRRAFFEGVRPAITTVFVSGLVSPEWLIEVEATANTNR